MKLSLSLTKSALLIAMAMKNLLEETMAVIQETVEVVVDQVEDSLMCHVKVIVIGATQMIGTMVNSQLKAMMS